MRAYRLVAWEQLPRHVEVSVPRPGPGEVLVKVAGNGLCHSDIAMRQIPEAIGEMLGWQMPFTLGHEIGGWIAELGEGVAGFEVGEAVALVSPKSCGSCWYCLRGRDSACTQESAGRGYGRDGGLAEFVVAAAPREVIKLTTLDPATAGPLTDAGATSYHAVSRLVPRLPPGSSAAVIGAGGLGAFAVQLLRVLTPAHVLAVDVNPARLELASELGAHEVSTELTSTVDAVLDFVGIDDTIARGVAAVRPYGAYALVGAGGGSFGNAWYGGLPRDGEVFTFQGSNIADVHEVIALAEAGLIRNEVDLFSFDRVDEAYEKLDAGELRGRAVVTITS